MRTDSAGAATPALEVPSSALRVDQVLESKHKFVSSRPGIVEFEDTGRRLRLVLWTRARSRNRAIWVAFPGFSHRV